MHGEVADGEELAIAFVIGEREERWIQRAQKSGRAAAMLHVGPVVLADRGEVERIPRGDEGELLLAEGIALAVR